MYAPTSRTTNGTATRPSTTTPPRQGRTGLKRVARDPELRRRSSQANRPQWHLVSPPATPLGGDSQCRAGDDEEAGGVRRD